MKMQKRSHLGMAGHYAAMAEFLFRGYNVAIPAVDVGDDVLVIDDGQGTVSRVQVKTIVVDDGDMPEKTDPFKLSRAQLRETKRTNLFYMFMIRWHRRWRFLLIPREELAAIREEIESAPRDRKRGQPPKRDFEARGDGLTLWITWKSNSAPHVWGTSLSKYLDAWPDALPVLDTGPGTVATGPRPSSRSGSAAGRDRSADPR